ncbi:MAG: hypothetical protein ACOYMQ_18545 [Pseudanabaena sp.]
MTTNVFVNLELVDSSLDAEDLQLAARNLLKQVGQSMVSKKPISLL